MRAIDLINTCSKKGAAAAQEEWHAARNQGLFVGRTLSPRDQLDLQILLAIFMKIQGVLDRNSLELCLDLIGRAGIPPETQAVYLMFVSDLAFDAGVRGLQLQETTAKGFDWEVADALSNISENFDKRVAAIRKAVKKPPLN